MEKAEPATTRHTWVVAVHTNPKIQKQIEAADTKMKEKEKITQTVETCHIKV